MVCILCLIPLYSNRSLSQKMSPSAWKHYEKNLFKVQQRSWHSLDTAILSQGVVKTRSFSKCFKRSPKVGRKKKSNQKGVFQSVFKTLSMFNLLQEIKPTVTKGWLNRTAVHAYQYKFKKRVLIFVLSRHLFSNYVL